MLSRINISRRSVHFNIYYASLCLLVISLPSSRYFITISLILLIVNWLAEGNFQEKFKKFSANKPAIAFTLIYALNILGLLWSVDIKYAFHNDLLHKSPTLFMPIIIVTSPMLDVKRIRLLLVLFISSVVTVSLIGLSIRALHPNISFRDASPFMPGIYYGMMLILAAFQLPLLIKQISNNRALLLLGLALSLWLILFLFYLRALSGIASFAGVSGFLLALFLYSHKSTFLKLAITASFLLLSGFAVWPLIKIYRQTQSEVETDFRTLEEYTEFGNKYTHDTTSIQRENGHLVFIYIAEEELKEAWNSKSEQNSASTDFPFQKIRYTLFRYMSSKGLRKDKHDFMLLTDRDIRAVEEGVTNHLNINRPGFYVRVYEEMRGFYIYRKSSFKEASRSSFTERLDQWRASVQAFKKHPILGWGTGSILHAVEYGFVKNGSSLVGKNMKPHNQYMCTLLTLGVLGSIVVLLLYIYVVVKTGVYKIVMFNIFLIVFAVNFLGNNSLESQLGQNLFVFFTLFYCFIYPQLKTSRTPVF